MKELTFRVVSNHIEAERIWNELSPNKFISDTWAFRYTNFKYTENNLLFIVGYDKGKIIGLLPLQYNPAKEILESFARRSSDDELIWLKSGYKRCASQFLAQIQQPAYLTLGSKPYSTSEHNSELIEYRYVLDLQGYTGYEDYIQKTWKPKNSKKILKEVAALKSAHTIEVIENNYEDLELMFALNCNRFGEDSIFRHHRTKQVYRDFLTHFNVHMLTIKVDGVKEAVSYGIIFNNRYIGMNNGTNRAINNLGKFTILLKIEAAIKLGLIDYSAGKGDFGGWKQTFQFTKIPQYQLTLD